MLRWMRLLSTLATFSALGCDTAPEHGAHEVPVSKAVSPELDQNRPETGPTQKIPTH